VFAKIERRGIIVDDAAFGIEYLKRQTREHAVSRELAKRAERPAARLRVRRGKQLRGAVGGLLQLVLHVLVELARPHEPQDASRQKHRDSRDCGESESQSSAQRVFRTLLAGGSDHPGYTSSDLGGSKR